MEDDAFENWFRKCFIPYIDKTNIDRPVLYLMAIGLVSNIQLHNLPMIWACLLCLPPNSSSKLQPLDAGVYGPAKSMWRNILNNFYAAES